MTSRRRTVITALGAGLLAALALGGCSASGSSSSSAGGGAAAVAPAGPAAADAGAPGIAAPAAAGSESGAAGSSAQKQSSAGGQTSASNTLADQVAGDKLVRTASMQVQVDDVEAKASDARRIAVAAGGAVTDENSSAVPLSSNGTVDKQGSRSILTLSVPADALDAVLDQLGRLGTTASRSSSSRDVTATYVDTQSRITTMTAGLDQLQGLLAKTTGLDQVVTLETEISRRQGDLDALQAQLKALSARTTMSTVTLTLVTAAQVVVPEDESGFLGGLTAGWRAFLRTGGGLLTVLGAVLPFVLTLAVLGVPLLVWRRRRRTTAPAGAVPPPSPGGSTGTGGNGPAGGNGPGGSAGPGPAAPESPDPGEGVGPQGDGEPEPDGEDAHTPALTGAR